MGMYILRRTSNAFAPSNNADSSKDLGTPRKNS